MRDDDAGFSLIELLVVVIILAILAAVVVFAVGGLGDKGGTAACKTEIKTIETAANAYFAQNQTATPSLEALIPAFLSQDSNINNNTKSVSGANGYTITFTPGSGTSAGTAEGDLNGGAATTDCSD